MSVTSKSKRQARNRRFESCVARGKTGLFLEPLEERTLLAVDLAVGFNSNEPDVAVDPNNSNVVAVAQFRTVKISFDRGATFPITTTVNAPNGYAGAGGDPSLSFDSQDRLYFSYLASNAAPANPSFKTGLFAARFDINASNQTAPLAQNTTIAIETNSTENDKEWVAADHFAGSPFKDNAYVIWTQLGGASQILFSRTTDGGVTWSVPHQQLDNGSSGFVSFSDVSVAPNGDVWTAWHTHSAETSGTTGEVRMRRSTDGGVTFQPELANLPFTAGTADINVNYPPNPRIPGLLSLLLGSEQPRILTDPIHPGTLYVVTVDNLGNNYSSGDQSDIRFARSTDDGTIWATSTISHGPLGTFQIMPAATIDELGNIAVTWYDNRRGLKNSGLDGIPGNADDDFLLDVYGTVSRDGGLTFSNDFRLTDTAFDPDLGAGDFFTPPQNVLRIGEYFGLAAAGGTVFADWTGNNVGGQQILFDKFNMLGPFADSSETNNTISTATILGSPPAVTLQDKTLNTPDAVDFYKYTAHDTGKLDVNIFYDKGVTNVDVQVVDARGNLIASGFESNVAPGLDLEHIPIPVVAGQEYFVKVFPNNPLPNPVTYNLEIENFAAPSPEEVNLDVTDDSGSNSLDLVTFRTSQLHYFVHADLSDFVAAGINILSAAAATAGVTPGAAVQVFINGAAAGFANAIAGTNDTIFDVNLDADLTKFPIGGPNAAGPLGYLGFTNFITAAVRMFDGQKNSGGSPTPATGRSQLSDPLRVVADNTAPLAPSTPDLLPSSDSGALNSDNVTSVNPPAFQGTGEANTKIAIRANGVVIGQGVVGTDASDGVLGNGLGTWEVTTEPLADGAYTITAGLEDLAGNIGPSSTSLNVTIDTIDGGGKPQRPTLDLVDAFDTGLSDKDNVTNLHTLNFLVSAEAGSSVVIKDGNTVIDTFVMPGTPFTTRTLVLADGPHPLSAEATDLAGNHSDQSQELLVTVDSVLPGAPTTPDLLASSDTGTFNDDNVTHLQALAFQGTAESNTRILILANGVVVGQGLVGTDLTAPPTQLPGSPPAIGAWEVTTEPLTDGTYTITAEVEDQAGNISLLSGGLTVTVDTITPDTPYLDLTDASDTGRHNYDNVTNDNTPTVTVTADDVHAAGLNLAPHDIRYRIFDRFGTGPDTLLVDSFVTIPGLSTTNFFSNTLTTLADGVHDLKVEVEDRAGNVSHAFLLQVTIDIVVPPGFFGAAAIPTDGLDPASDSGVVGDPATFTDRITNVTTPSFFGSAEADSIVRVSVDVDGIPATTGDDVPLGKTVAVPLDGNFAFLNGQWNLQSIVDLNNPSFFPHDGIRRLLVTAEDLAGNVSAPQQLDIFIDTQGPQVTNVQITDHPGFNLFGLKPNNAPQGPTPLIFSLTISLQDLPVEDAEFLRNAIEAGVAQTQGLITLRGDHNGVIQISDIIVTNDPPIVGEPATASIELVFDTPLPDDRFTLTIFDTIPDPAGNRLDGENNAIQPTDFPLFPSGDGQPGGNFLARFTVDSRPEIGSYAAANVFIDANGNFLADPQGQNNDFTNRDLTFALGIVPALAGVVSPMGIHDTVFAGNFPGLFRDEEVILPHADGFDKLAAYGFDSTVSAYRWLIDTNNDGIIDPAAGDFATIQGAGFQINGLPVAGNFDGNTINGDEIGLFDGTKWYFDTNHDHKIDAGDLVTTTNLRGAPIVGDFNGDGVLDLATFKDDVFYFNFGTQPGGPGTQPAWSGSIDATIHWGLPGTSELPVAADMDKDGIADIGLFVPARAATLPISSGNWYFLISNDFDKDFRGGKQVTALDHPFSPAPLGNDLFAQFGDAFALPVVGNFDPPITTPTLPAPQNLAPLLGASTVASQTASGDQWYSVQPLRSGTLSVDVASTSGTLDVHLYDTNYALMGSASAGEPGHMLLQQSVTAGETCLVHVSASGSVTSLQISNQISDVDRFDTSRNGMVSALDALRVINELNSAGSHATPLDPTNPKLYFDVNLDGRISPLDALQVINYLMAHTGSAAPAALPTSVINVAASLPSASPTSASAPGAGAAVTFGLSVTSAASSVAPAAGSSSVVSQAADAVYAQLATAPVAASASSPPLSDDSDPASQSADSSASAEFVLAVDPDLDWVG